ncbi:UNVERIFIED_CONTAM: hypothetical protein RMT77_016315 [Armadillidium vulgare]
MNQIRFIGSQEVKKALTWQILIPATEKSLAAFSRGPLHNEGAIQPLRSTINLQDKNGVLLVMPGYLPSQGALATKLVTTYPNNSEIGKSSHNAIVVLMDENTGEMKAVIDGSSITELRTAASSGVASLYLASKSVKKVAVLGAGTQGASHARIHHYLFKPQEIRVWSRTQSRAEKLVENLRHEGIEEAIVASSVKEATSDADVINTCTLSTTPVLHSEHVKNGAHVNAVGAPFPNWRELDDELMASSVVYADSKEAAIVESGDVIGSKAQVYAEIGEVIEGQKEGKRDKITIYKNLGVAVLDAMSARLTYDFFYKNLNT